MNSGATFACEALAVWPRARILQYLFHKNKAMIVVDVALRFGMSKYEAWGHLEALVRVGLAYYRDEGVGLGVYSGDPAGLQNLIDELSSIMKGKK